ncbi:unnamed protein product, partial [Didymodactylos carnosus]
MPNLWINCLFLILCSLLNSNNGSHFEGGTITYKVVNYTSSTVSIILTQSYTYILSIVFCNNTYISSQTQLNFGIYPDQTSTINCTANCSTSGGFSSIPVRSYCTDYSSALGITTGQRSDLVTLSNNSYFFVSYIGASYRNLTLYSTLYPYPYDFVWYITCLINLRPRPDGRLNTPPAATIISPMYIPVGIQQYIDLPTIDVDNDNVRCRFSSGISECGSVCAPSSLPNNTQILNNCTLIITGAKVGNCTTSVSPETTG